MELEKFSSVFLRPKVNVLQVQIGGNDAVTTDPINILTEE